ncbi:hypothetical protein G5B40_08645 [Pikeienuella piscinae]|uniref:Uncharacterized protein n=1 Tax=Pikeienuella piscinae TaxID=2748098 RepID=A0A7L5BVT7_9RHOB|nr:hypothetical protein [Pikeienuella piscinae]QIE55521.1 hypothetical protein G5B40_08645 [Pikeienuella piscinae]
MRRLTQPTRRRPARLRTPSHTESGKDMTLLQFAAFFCAALAVLTLI